MKIVRDGNAVALNGGKPPGPGNACPCTVINTVQGCGVKK